MMQTRERILEALESYKNGNVSDFKAWLKRSSKPEILHAIEIHNAEYGNRHEIINAMRILLE